MSQEEIESLRRDLEQLRVLTSKLQTNNEALKDRINRLESNNSRDENFLYRIGVGWQNTYNIFDIIALREEREYVE